MWQMMTIQETIRKLKTDKSIGLTDVEIKKRQEKYGLNKLNESKKENIFIRFIKQFNDFMIIILIIAALISWIISYIEGSNEYIDSIIIILIVTLNAIMGLIQESKAEKSLEALKKMSEPTTKVKRNGIIKTVQTSDIVPGDYIIIEAGSYVPADARLTSSYNLKVEESALTGENTSIIKNADAILKKDIPTGDIVNMVFATTIVVARTCRSNSNRNRNGYKSG